MRRQEAGFTLIEVLVVFTVLTVSLGTLLPSFSTSLSAQQRAAVQAAALLKAGSKLAELGSVVALTPGQEQGSYDDGTAWRVTVTDHPDASLAAALPKGLALYAVTLEITSGDEPLTRLTTLRFGAAP